MKKIYSFMFVVLICFGALVATSSYVSAQARVGRSFKSHGSGELITKSPGLPFQSTFGLRSTSESFVLNAAFANDSVNRFLGFSSSSIHAFPLFNDTSVLFHFIDGDFPTSIHLCGNVLDPLSENMQFWSGNTWDQSTDYTVDSMAVEFVYRRNISNNVADTMVVYLYNDSNYNDLQVYNLSRFYYGSWVMNFGVTDTVADSLLCMLMAYDINNLAANRPLVTTPGSMKRLAIPLTTADTGVVIKAFSTNHFHVPAGHRAVSAVGFTPGYSYVTGDNITNTKNSFRIIYYQQNGDGAGSPPVGTYPTYFGIGGKTDWNLSELITSNERYNVSGDFWQGLFVPPYDWAKAFDIEEFPFSYLVTSSFTTGLNENVSATGVKLYQNQPNPFNHTTTIKYETQLAGTVVFEVRDLTGRLVMELNQGTQSAGKHAAVIDVSELSKGMYLYTLKTNNESLTRRMIVSE